VLRGNESARRFYERLGGSVLAEKTDLRPEASLDEVAYGWRDVSLLLGA
jgi:hypothetical protein